MTMSNYNDAGFIESSHCEGQTAYHNRPQSRFRNRPCSSVHPDFDLKTPRTHLSVNRGNLSIPYKSKMCLLFRRGKCSYGENCHFSHSVTGIRKPGFNPVGPEMKECHWFSSGVDCPYGNRCQFLHKCDKKIKDVDLQRQSSGVDAVSGGMDRSGKNCVELRGRTAGEDDDKMVRGKLKPHCSKWERFGSYPYGMKSIYAHGREEHQDLIFQPDMEHNYASKSSKPISAACAFGPTTSMNWELKAKRCFTKWDIRMVSEVYADWID